MIIQMFPNVNRYGYLNNKFLPVFVFFTIQNYNYIIWKTLLSIKKTSDFHRKSYNNYLVYSATNAKTSSVVEHIIALSTNSFILSNDKFLIWLRA